MFYNAYCVPQDRGLTVSWFRPTVLHNLPRSAKSRPGLGSDSTSLNPFLFFMDVALVFLYFIANLFDF